MLSGLVVSLLGLLGPAPLYAPRRSASRLQPGCVASPGEELGAVAAERRPPAVVPPRNTTQGRLLACASRLQVLQPSATLISIGKALRGQPLNAHNLTSLLLLLKRRRRWKQAALLFEYAQADRVPMRTAHYNLLMSACAHGSPRRALELFDQLRSGAAHGVKPDSVSFNTAMSAAAHAGVLDQVIIRIIRHRPARSCRARPKHPQLDHPYAHPEPAFRQVHSIFSELPAHGLQPTTISFNIAIAAAAKTGDWQRALAYFRDMEPLKIERTSVTYTAVIDACARGGELQKALTLFTYMEVAGIKRNSVTYAVGITGCSRGGEPERGLHLFEQMLQRGVTPDVVVYNAAISCCAQLRDVPGAVALLEGMRRAGLEPTAVSYGAAVSACEKGGDWQQAVALLGDMWERKVSGKELGRAGAQPAQWPAACMHL